MSSKIPGFMICTMFITSVAAEIILCKVVYNHRQEMHWIIVAAPQLSSRPWMYINYNAYNNNCIEDLISLPDSMDGS